MASTEEIVTRFTADISDLETSVQKGYSLLKKYEDFADGAARSGENLSASVGSLTAKTMALEGAQRKVIATEKEQEAIISSTVRATRDLASAQAQVGNVQGFQAAGKAATEEAARIDALIAKIKQLREAHAAAGSIEVRAPLAADIGAAQQELRSIPVPAGATNTAAIASALLPLQEIQQQAPAAAAAVDKAAQEINADLASIGGANLDAFDELNTGALQVLNTIQDLPASEQSVIDGANRIVREYEEIVRTGEQFPGQLNELSARAAQAAKQVNEIAAQEERAQKAAAGLGAEANKLPPVFDRVADAATRQANASTQSANANARNTQQTGILGRALNALKGAFGGIKQGATDFAASVRSSFSSSVGQFRAGSAALDVLKGGLAQASGSLGGIASGFAGLAGPIGIAAGAVAGFVANLSRLDSVKVFFDGLGNSIDFALNRLANFDFKGLFDPATQRRDAAVAAFLAEEADKLEDSQLGLNKVNREAEVQLAGLNQKLRDRTKSEQERLAIAEQITSIEEARAKEEIDFIDEKIRLQSLAGAAELRTLGEVSDENKKALSELLGERAAAEARSINLTETVERRRNAIIEEGENARQRAEQKSEEASRKAREAQERNAAARAEAEKSLASITGDLQDQTLRAGLKARDQEAFDIDQKYDQLVTKAAEAFGKLRVLAGEGTPGADTAALESLATKEKDVRAQIQAARDAAQKAATDKALADELKARQEFNKQVGGEILSANEQQLSLLRQRIDAGQILNSDDQAKYLDLIQRVNEAEIKAAQDKYDRLLSDNARYNSDANGLTEDGKKREAEIIALKDAEILAANAEAQTARQAQNLVFLQQNLDTLTGFADQAIQVLAQAAADGQATGEEAARQIILLALDTLEKIVLMNAVNAQTGAIAGNAPLGPTGVAKGLIEGALVATLIKGLFAVVKSTIAAKYTGESFVRGRQTWPGRDGHLRRVDTGERIVTAKANAEHYDLFEAAEGGTLHDYLRARYVIPAINRYLDSDDGRRVASSTLPAPFHDAGIVKAINAERKEQQRTNELLAQMLKQRPRVITPSRRSWN